MAPVLTATLDPTNSPPRVLLQLTGADGARVTITRYNDDGTNHVVRDADGDALIGGAITVYDYDAPHARTANYFAVTDGTTNVSAAVGTFRALGVAKPWLIHPGIPSLSMPLRSAGRGPRTYPVNRGVQDVQGRADAVVASDGKRKLPSFDLMVLTGSLAEDQKLKDLLDDSSVLLLQLGYTTTDRVFYGWVSIGDVEENDVVEWMGSELLQWTLPCQVTSRPIGKLQAQRTYADVLNDFGTYAELAKAYSTYNDMLINNRL